MKKYFRFIISAAVLVGIFSVSVFALTENEVQNEVTRIGREGVTGNIFVWFLCAVAFLKVSQKIDSFMSSLGINGCYAPERTLTMGTFSKVLSPGFRLGYIIGPKAALVSSLQEPLHGVSLRKNS